MPITLYQMPLSSPCRAVEMTAEHAGVQLEKKLVNLLEREHLKPEFLEMNPQHSVPTIDDDGFILWESRAIQAYLIDQYAPGNPLYPTDPKERAQVNKILNFDLGNLYKAVIEFYRPHLFTKDVAVDPVLAVALRKSLAILEKILEKKRYTAGNHMTIADHSILSHLVFLEIIVDYSFKDYPKISDWLHRMKEETPNYEKINEIPLKESKEWLKTAKLETKALKETFPLYFKSK